MKSVHFSMWETTHRQLITLEKKLGEKRGQVLNKNFIISEALKLLMEKESFL